MNAKPRFNQNLELRARPIAARTLSRVALIVRRATIALTRK